MKGYVKSLNYKTIVDIHKLQVRKYNFKQTLKNHYWVN